MIKVDKIAVTLLACLLSIASVHGQVFPRDTHSAERLSLREGLPFDYVDDIFQDESGFIWISLYGGGLTRYDGNGFLTFTTSTDQRISSNYVTMTCQDSFQRLWITTRQGIDLIDLRRLEVIPLPEEVRSEVGDNFCNCITRDATGCLWFSARRRLYRLSFTAEGGVQSLQSVSLVAEGSSGSMANLQIFRDVEQNGTMWVAIGRHLCRIVPTADGQLETESPYGNMDIGEDNKVTGFVRKGNEVWFSSEQGVFRVDTNSGNWKHYRHDPADPGSLASDRVPAIALSEAQHILIGTIKGLNVYDPLSDSFGYYNSDVDEDGNKCLYNDFINCIQAVGQDIWIGTEVEGVTLLKRKRLGVTNVQRRPNDSDSFPMSPVSAIFFDGEGLAWLGLVQDGLYCQNPDRKGFRSVPTSASRTGTNTVNAIEEGPQGILWAGSLGGGLDRLERGRDGRVRSVHISPEGDGPYPLFIYDLQYDPLHRFLWIGAQDAIYCYDTVSSKFRPELTVTTNSCFCLCIDSSGTLWAGNQNGIIRIDLHTLTVTESNVIQRVFCIAEGPGGEMLVGTNGDGLFVLEKGGTPSDTESVRHLDTGDGLPDNRIHSILPDNQDLWVATPNGLALVSGEGIDSFAVSDGLASERFYRNAACRAPWGGLCFGHVSGFSVVLPGQKPLKERECRLLFTGMSVSGVPSVISDTQKVRLHERDRSVSFSFADLSFYDPRDLTFKYRLYPGDTGWTTLDSREEVIRLGSLRSGKKTLQLKAENHAGATLGQTGLNLEIKPYFYKTPGFILAALLLLFLLTQIVIRARTGILTKRQEALQKEIDRQVQRISEQKQALEQQTEELMRQNRQLAKQNEELASHKLKHDLDFKGEGVRTGESFLDKAMRTVKESYKDSTLDIGAFSRAMGMSRSMLNLKMKESTGMPVGQFIRTYRLSVAKEILLHKDKSDLNIAEVAYEVGFNDPKYFTRCFTREFGYPPSSINH